MKCTPKEGYRDNPSIVVIAENNILDEIDMSIEYCVKLDQDRNWRQKDIKVYHPPLFKIKNDGASHE